MKSTTASASFSRLVTRLVGLAAAATIVVGCDAFQDLEVPFEVDSTLRLTLDVGSATGPAAGQTAPADASYAVDLPPTRVDLLSGNPELAKNRAKLVSIALVGVSVNPVSSTLTAASPPLEVYIAAKGATTLHGAVHIGTVPPIPPGATATVPVDIDPAAQAAAQPFLLTLDFTVLTATSIDVDAGDVVPGGGAVLDVTLGVRAIINVLR